MAVKNINQISSTLDAIKILCQTPQDLLLDIFQHHQADLDHEAVLKLVQILTSLPRPVVRSRQDEPQVEVQCHAGSADRNTGSPGDLITDNAIIVQDISITTCDTQATEPESGSDAEKSRLKCLIRNLCKQKEKIGQFLNQEASMAIGKSPYADDPRIPDLRDAKTTKTCRASMRRSLSQNSFATEYVTYELERHGTSSLETIKQNLSKAQARKGCIDEFIKEKGFADKSTVKYGIKHGLKLLVIRDLGSGIIPGVDLLLSFAYTSFRSVQYSALPGLLQEFLNPSGDLSLMLEVARAKVKWWQMGLQLYEADCHKVRSMLNSPNPLMLSKSSGKRPHCEIEDNARAMPSIRYNQPADSAVISPDVATPSSRRDRTASISSLNEVDPAANCASTHYIEHSEPNGGPLPARSSDNDYGPFDLGAHATFSDAAFPYNLAADAYFTQTYPMDDLASFSETQRISQNHVPTYEVLHEHHGNAPYQLAADAAFPGFEANVNMLDSTSVSMFTASTGAGIGATLYPTGAASETVYFGRLGTALA